MVTCKSGQLQWRWLSLLDEKADSGRNGGDTVELKPCPFCGNRNIEKHIATQYDDESGLQPVRTFFSAVCSCCGCRTASFHELGNVENAWNMRANDG